MEITASPLFTFLAMPVVVTFFFAFHLILGGELDVCRRGDLFFCSSLDFGRKIRIVFICVDLCGVRNNKLLNLGVRDLKKVENH